MLKSIRLQNFFGFQDCTINLEKGANVLVGINGSGKSNFFKAIRLLSNLPLTNGATDLLYNKFGGLDNIVFGKKRTDPHKLDISLSFQIGEPYEREQSDFSDYGSFIYKCDIETIAGYDFYLLENVIGVGANNKKVQLLEFNKGYKVTNHSRTITDTDVNDRSKSFLADGNLPWVPMFRYYLRNKILGLKVYESFDSSFLSELRKPNPPRNDKYLLLDGSNLASLLNDIKLSDKETFNRILNSLKSVNDKYAGIEFKQLSGFIEMWLEEEGLNRAISPIHISDGTLKFLCLMAILYNPNRGSVVCIDEPELGLHPDMINTLYEAIEFAAETSQIIISTHSAHLLDYFDLEQIRVFEKDENNATIVKKYTEEEFSGWYEHFYPGQMWRAGNIGGNRW